MIDKLPDVIRYLCRHYPHGRELSKARLTKMIYLADWRCAIQHDRQITNIEWYFNHFGPYVRDVLDAALHEAGLRVVIDENRYGARKERIELHDDDRPIVTLNNEDRSAIDHIIRQTRRLTWRAFIQLVYSTYPIRTQERYTDLDLVSLAREYRDSAWFQYFRAEGQPE